MNDKEFVKEISEWKNRKNEIEMKMKKIMNRRNQICQYEEMMNKMKRMEEMIGNKTTEITRQVSGVQTTMNNTIINSTNTTNGLINTVQTTINNINNTTNNINTTVNGTKTTTETMNRTMSEIRVFDYFPGI